MNDNDIRLGCTNLQGILDSKRTIRYESISDILISMFSGVNKCSQGRNIFVIDFGSSRYQNFVISLICISTEFPAHNTTPSKVPKTAIVQVPTAPPPPELATTYIKMWARFTDGATLPDPLLRIFQSQRYMLDTSIVRSEVLGYGLVRRIAIANKKVVDRHAISAS